MGLGLHVAAEVRMIGLALEAHQVVREQRAYQPVVPRYGCQDQRRGQGDVQEEADAMRAAQRPQFGGQRDQVVVVYPDDVVLAQHRLELAREQLVDPPVAGDVAGVEVRQVQPVVEDRPEHAVGIAQVVGIVVFTAQIQGDQLHPARLGAVHFAFACLAAGRRLHDLAAPAEPQAARVVEHVGQCHGQAAGRGLARIGHAVGNDDQAAHGAPLQITVSQGADSRTAALIRPTIE